MITFMLDRERERSDAKVQVLVGPDPEHLALAGVLTMSHDEYEALTMTLIQGVLNPPDKEQHHVRLIGASH